MVSGDQGRRALSAFMLSALFGCGCLQTQTGDGPFRSMAGGFGSRSAADGSVVLAVAKPARGGPAANASEPAQARTPSDGPDLNPIQPASATSNVPEPEQAPPPRPQAPDVAGTAAPAGPAPVAKDPPIAAPDRAAIPPAPPGHVAADPTLAARRAPTYPPGSAGLVPPGGVALDPHQRSVPTASGSLLNLPPGESPAERAVELSYRVQALDAERVVLEQRAHELTAALEIRDRALVQHGHDIHEAAEEVAKAREQVATWRKELEEARIRLKSRELEDVQTLKAIIALLERLTENNASRENRQERTTAPMAEE